MKYQIVISNLRSTKSKEICNWLDENIGERYEKWKITWEYIDFTDDNEYDRRFWFKNEEDYVLFCLRWV